MKKFIRTIIKHIKDKHDNLGIIGKVRCSGFLGLYYEISMPIDNNEDDIKRYAKFIEKELSKTKLYISNIVKTKKLVIIEVEKKLDEPILTGSLLY